ncbi:uncharacterized protein F5Z01DRAFT_641555 [Emericellopsis atlantica]|uniref:DUF7730 domain-containing protein n=1 Tax=Emericellopsis atlantica TaxID=2614577 RepID=A0A9P8CU09_9HYPO|nr:uncharacterized protein F5Z01DRAFT_641555 [Emericellopsis atlantica]KAG9258852.1 hypothetical protein F5Z01DRAFT_641555 [Emericellopsis atlantica]
MSHLIESWEDEKRHTVWDPARPATQPINLSNASPQNQSLFLAKLPLGVRHVIYGHLWALNGLEQHIFAETVWDDEPVMQGLHLPPVVSTSTVSENRNSENQRFGFHLELHSSEKPGNADIDADTPEENDRDYNSGSHADGSLMNIDDSIENESDHDADDYFAQHPDSPPYVSPAHSMADSSRSPSIRGACSSPSSLPPDTQVGHIRRRRCTTDYAHPDISSPNRLSALCDKRAKHCERHGPTFVDGTDPTWDETCYCCKEAYDCLFAKHSNPDPPKERSDFMAMLLVCKSMYGEVLPSVMEHVRWSFTKPQHLSQFLKMQFPMIHLIRRIIVLWDIRQSFDSQLAEWKASLPLLAAMENLKELEIWMDYKRAWVNNEERLEMEDPRQARIWAMAPTNVQLRVTYPKRVAESYSHEPEDAAPYLVRFVRGTGGWVNLQEVHSDTEN